MKIRFCTLIFLLTSWSATYSQIENFDLDHTHSHGHSHAHPHSHGGQEEMIAFIQEFNKTKHSFVRDDDPIFVPIRFHMVARNDGSGRVPGASVLGQMGALQKDFKKLGIYLYLDEDSFEYLNNTSIYETPGSFENLIKSKKDPDAVNVFVCENADVANATGNVLGFFSVDGDYIVMRRSEVRQATASLTHEMGHFFSLPHTFFGWEGVFDFYGWSNGWNVNQFNGQYTLPTCPGNNYPVELMDGSNCETSGDGICDTPPDYNFGFGAPQCKWNDVIRDPNGDIVDPQENNIMSYFTTCDEYVFTEGQADIMVANFNSPARAHLKSNYVPDTTEIFSDYELVEPAEAELLEFNQSVRLNWSDADGASQYVVSLTSQAQEFSEYYVTESELILEELDPNSFYFWSVKPYNEGNAQSIEKESFFTTGNGINTSVKESELIQNVIVYPNPGYRGQDINVSISLEESNDVTISLFDVTGRILSTAAQRFNKGENTYNINAVNESGIYFIKLDTKDGSIHKKIVIQ
ncbi:MAG: zinc-dependent metalloprotease [Bacteroidota bacterium]